jgi:ATP-dependent DNA helicase RecQ
MVQTTIYSIGYGARSLDELTDLLRRHGIEYLLDVRSRPYSRSKAEYCKAALEEALAGLGVRYVFMGETLGGLPDDADHAARTEALAFQGGLARLRKAFQQQARVALFCCEARPEHCHRALVIGAALAAEGIPVAHIDEQGEVLSQVQVLHRLDSNSGPSPENVSHQNGKQMGQVENLDHQAPMPDWEAPLPVDEDMPEFAHAGDFDPGRQEEIPARAGASGHERPALDLDRLRSSDPPTILKQVFGYDSFRPLQSEVIDSVLRKQDALAVMPTGSGKSLCYQLPSLVFPGLTVVVSPLIALMEDQVVQAREIGLPAVFLNSTVPAQEYQWIMDDVRAGRSKLLFAAPETLVRPGILELLEQSSVDCLTIDEAHCISEWGHDFRPEYRQLLEVRRRLPKAVCLAVTATATERVRQDIKASLGIDDAHEFLASFNRENLYLEVAAKTDGPAQLFAFLQAHEGASGIIYCATRRQVDVLTELLFARGISALPYHAGLEAGTRQRHQGRFIRDDVQIMVATIAFGMGINKSNIRFVLHYDLPKNLESYYQQVGRAGRDGLRADCLLLFTYADVQTIVSFIRQMEPALQKPARMQLEAMLAFAESQVCRRAPLLTYFNEVYSEKNCGMCDNCCKIPKELTDLTLPAQKFLSCVKRTGEMFGMSHVIDVLRGSRSEKVLSRGHDRLSTYRVGVEYSKKQWQHLGRQFIQAGLLTQDMEHGSLRLTPKAYAVFQGEQVLGALPEQTRGEIWSSRDKPVRSDHDPELFDLLRARRKVLAEAGNIPPYQVFSDRTLQEMATLYPQSPQTLATIHGVGQVKLARYAGDFLPIIQEYCAKNGIAERISPPVELQPRAETTGMGTRTLEVVALYESGQSIADIAETFHVKPGTVISHLWRAVQAGQIIRRDGLLEQSLLSPETRQRVLDAFAEHGIERLRPVFEALDGGVSYDDLHLLRMDAMLGGKQKRVAG